MSGLLTALQSSANSLAAFQHALDAVQNNVTNSSTPGYARQRLSLEALPFQPSCGSAGRSERGRTPKRA